MSIGNVGGPNYPIPPSFGSQDSQNPDEILQEYDRVYMQFVNDPCKSTAQNFLLFLQGNNHTLSQFAIYPPYLGETWGRLYGDMTRDLQAFIGGHIPSSAVLEIANNMRIMLGVNVTPNEVLAMFQEALAVFKADPNDQLATDTLYLYLTTPGYESALAQAGHALANFSAICNQAANAVEQVRNGTGSIAAAMEALQDVSQALNIPF